MGRLGSSLKRPSTFFTTTLRGLIIYINTTCFGGLLTAACNNTLENLAQLLCMVLFGCFMCLCVYSFLSPTIDSLVKEYVPRNIWKWYSKGYSWRCTPSEVIAFKFINLVCWLWKSYWRERYQKVVYELSYFVYLSIVLVIWDTIDYTYSTTIGMVCSLLDLMGFVGKGVLLDNAIDESIPQEIRSPSPQILKESVSDPIQSTPPPSKPTETPKPQTSRYGAENGVNGYTPRPPILHYGYRYRNYYDITPIYVFSPKPPTPPKRRSSLRGRPKPYIYVSLDAGADGTQKDTGIGTEVTPSGTATTEKPMGQAYLSMHAPKDGRVPSSPPRPPQLFSDYRTDMMDAGQYTDILPTPPPSPKLSGSDPVAQLGASPPLSPKVSTPTTQMEVGASSGIPLPIPSNINSITPPPYNEQRLCVVWDKDHLPPVGKSGALYIDTTCWSDEDIVEFYNTAESVARGIIGISVERTPSVSLVTPIYGQPIPPQPQPVLQQQMVSPPTSTTNTGCSNNMKTSVDKGGLKYQGLKFESLGLEHQVVMSPKMGRRLAKAKQTRRRLGQRIRADHPQVYQDQDQQQQQQDMQPQDQYAVDAPVAVQAQAPLAQPPTVTADFVAPPLPIAPPPIPQQAAAVVPPVAPPARVTPAQPSGPHAQQAAGSAPSTIQGWGGEENVSGREIKGLKKSKPAQTTGIAAPQPLAEASQSSFSFTSPTTLRLLGDAPPNSTIPELMRLMREGNQSNTAPPAPPPPPYVPASASASSQPAPRRATHAPGRNPTETLFINRKRK